MALQRLCAPALIFRAPDGWRRSRGFPEIALQHLYRTNGFLAEVREELEKALFARDRDLFSQELDVVFLDTTSVSIYRDRRRNGANAATRGTIGRTLPQLVLGVAVDRKGWPVSWEVFPGEYGRSGGLRSDDREDADAVPDRSGGGRGGPGDDGEKEPGAFDSGKTPYDYILGCRMRKQKEIGAEVLARGRSLPGGRGEPEGQGSPCR